MRIDLKVREMFPDLNVLTVSIRGLTVEEKSQTLEEFKKEFMMQIRSRYTLETLKDVPELRSYRDFFWKIGIDPTKIRPASEALIRRIIQGKPLPTINTLVDSYNLASMESRIALAAFDSFLISPDLVLRFAEKGEKFIGIGMETPVTLEGNELVIESANELIALYPYRDAHLSRITIFTENAFIVVCGVPGISNETLMDARKRAEAYITRFCHGTVEAESMNP